MHNVAILSCGHVHTKNYCKNLAQRTDAKLSLIWDDMPDRGRNYAKEYGAEFTDDLAAAISRPDIAGLIICSENSRHLPLLEAAIPTGKPIFCEKPFTTTVADARRAMELIRKYKTPVFMGYFYPFNDQMQGAKQLLDAGAIGKITHARYRNAHHAAYGRWFDSPEVAWFTDPVLAGGGAFMDMGTHAVHAVRTLFGPAKRVFAAVGNASGVYPTVDDWGIALVEFASGVICTVEAAWVQTGGIGGLEVTGSKATLYNMPGRGMVTSGPNIETIDAPKAPARPVRIDRLVAAIEGKLTAQELADDLACAADAVAIMEACYQSHKTGAWVNVQSV